MLYGGELQHLGRLLSEVPDGSDCFKIVSDVLQLVEGMSTKEELQDLCRLLDFLAHEISGNCNFEFVQALLRLVLQVSRHKACSSISKLLLCLSMSIMLLFIGNLHACCFHAGRFR